MSAFELDFTLLRENYCRRQKTYINEADSTLTAIFRKLWALSEQPSLFYLRIYTLELIYELLHTEPRPSKTCGFYTELQVGIAKKAEQILTADLRKHIPVRLLAEILRWGNQFEKLLPWGVRPEHLHLSAGGPYESRR